MLQVDAAPEFSPLAWHPVLRHKTAGYECELKFKAFYFFLELHDLFISPFAFLPAANTRESFPHDVVFAARDLFPNRFAVVQRLLNRISNCPM